MSLASLSAGKPPAGGRRRLAVPSGHSAVQHLTAVLFIFQDWIRPTPGKLGNRAAGGHALNATSKLRCSDAGESDASSTGLFHGFALEPEVRGLTIAQNKVLLKRAAVPFGPAMCSCVAPLVAKARWSGDTQMSPSQINVWAALGRTADAYCTDC